jgi:arsenate reductase
MLAAAGGIDVTETSRQLPRHSEKAAASGKMRGFLLPPLTRRRIPPGPATLSKPRERRSGACPNTTALASLTSSMKSVRIYHNPRCSKSRATLALIQERELEPEVIDYLKTPPDEAALKALLDTLQLEPEQLVRKQEPLYRELELEGQGAGEIIRCMAEHPILIERPIVVCGGEARIGRPPERVLEILP